MTAFKSIIKNILHVVRDVLDPVFNFREVAVLCYHSVSDSTHETAIVPEVFAAHLDALHSRGYAFVSLADVVAWTKDGSLPPACAGRRKAVALTFDDGYADFETVVLPMLKRRSIPAALFVMGDPGEEWDAPLLTREVLERVRREPLVTVGWHSATHPDLTKLPPAEVVVEVAPPCGERYFAYPGGNHSPAAVAAVREAGYEAAFTIRPVLVEQGTDPYLLPRAVVTAQMSVRDVLFYCSRAAQWYMNLVSLWKR